MSSLKFASKLALLSLFKKLKYLFKSTSKLSMSNVVAALTPSLEHVGRSEIIHCTVSFVLAL
jgi:hypothetical protein